MNRCLSLSTLLMVLGACGDPPNIVRPEGGNGGLDSDEDDGVDEDLPSPSCVDARTYFFDHVWPEVLAPNCTGCHSVGGYAYSQSEFRLRLAPDFGDTEANYDVASQLAAAGLLTDKPSQASGTEHGGGTVIEPGSREASILAEFGQRVETGSVCEAEATSLVDQFQLGSDQAALRRATFAVLGRNPTVAEQTQLESDGFEVTVSSLSQTWVRERAFFDPRHGTLAAAMDEAFDLKSRYFRNGFTKFCLGEEGQLPHTRAAHTSRAQVNYSHRYLRRAEVSMDAVGSINALASDLIRRDRSLTELMTADYKMASPASALLYIPPDDWTPDENRHPNVDAGEAGFEPPSMDRMFSSFDEALGWGRLRSYPDATGADNPHVGVLGSDVFLCDNETELGVPWYDSSYRRRAHRRDEQNNYRHTATALARYFLGYDMFSFGSRVPSVDTEGSASPIERRECVSCHQQLDPLAAFFTSYTRRGYHLGENRMSPISRAVEDPTVGPSEVLGPAFLGERMPPGTPSRLAWLAERIAESERYASTLVQRLFFPLVFGRPAVELSQDPSQPEHYVEIRARMLEQALIEECAGRFRDAGLRAPVAIACLIQSNLFRVLGSESGADDLTRGVAFIFARRAITEPVRLHWFVVSLTGQPYAEGMLVNQTDDYRVLAGGQNGYSVTRPHREGFSATMAAMRERAALETACAALPPELDRVDVSQRFLGLVDASTAPGDEAIRQTIDHLVETVLGRTARDEERRGLLELFQSAADDPEPVCDDSRAALRGWVAVFSALLLDPEVQTR